jgi:hypothetical protein
MTPAVSAVLRGSLLKDPRRLPGIEAWYDVSEPSSLTYDSSNRVSLVADKAGKSSSIALVSDGSASNTATAATKSITGNQVMTFDIALTDWTPASNHTLFSKLTGFTGIEVLVLTTGVMRVRIGNGVAVTDFDSTAANTLTDLSRHTLVVTYVDNSSVSFTIDGVALGTSVAVNKVLSDGATTATIGTSFSGRIYRVKIGSLYDFNPSSSARMATSVADGVSGTWTINTSGATGARICGERDLYQGTVANQPVYLPWAGQNYGYLNGVSGNYFSATPPSVPTTQLEVAGRFDARVFATAATQNLGSQYGSPPGRSYLFLFLGASNVLRLVLSQDGTAETGVSSSATVPANTNAAKVTWRASDGRVQFFTSTDGGSNWSQLGADQTIAYASICTPTLPFQIGATHSAGTSNMLTGGCYWAYMASTIGGARISEFDASRYVSGSTFLASTGETWTLNGGAAIVTRSCLYFDGSNDYLKAAPFSLSQPETVQFVGSIVGWVIGKVMFDGNAQNAGSLYFKTATPRVTQYAGSDGATTTDLPVKTRGLLSSVLNGAASTLRVNRGVAATGNPGAANLGGFVAGYDNSAGYANITASEIAIYSQAQAQGVLDRFWSYAQRKWGLAP